MSKNLLTIALLVGAGVAAQAQKEGYSYEVASIKPNTSGSGNTSINTNDDTYTATNIGLMVVIEQAYGLQIPEQVVGLPGWAGSTHFDISAKLDTETTVALKALKGQEREEAERAMMQKLLSERFGLKMHREQRELAEYALVQAKGGSKLKPADAANPKAGNMMVRNGKMEAFSAEMQQLLYFLSFRVHRKVVDQTGLTGKFDMALEWTPEEQANSSADGAAEKAPGLFTALQEQLGLKLDSTKGSVDTVVIDRLEQPTEN